MCINTRYIPYTPYLHQQIKEMIPFEEYSGGRCPVWKEFRINGYSVWVKKTSGVTPPKTNRSPENQWL